MQGRAMMARSAGKGSGVGALLLPLFLVMVAALPRAAGADGGSGGTAAGLAGQVAACLAALAGDDSHGVEEACTAALHDPALARADRLTVLKERGAYLARHDKIDAAIADYSAAVEVDRSNAGLFNARGELWRTKGERPRAVQDFSAALRFDPGHDRARANLKAMARELERIGAEMALGGAPSFSCRQAKGLAEKAICADPELAALDRAIAAANARALTAARDQAEVRQLRRAQEGFMTERNTRMGHADYDLKKAMAERLRQISKEDGL